VNQTTQDRLNHYAEMKEEITKIQATVGSSDRCVTVVAGPGGSVLDIRLSDEAFHSVSPQSLAASITSTLRVAVAIA